MQFERADNILNKNYLSITPNFTQKMEITEVQQLKKTITASVLD